MMRVAEIFGPTIQGEGTQIGTPTLFVRFGGCDFRCVWCDTLYAVLPAHKATWHPMEASAIVDALRACAPPPYLVTLSGGNPALYDLTDLLACGHAAGYTFALETQGSKSPAWLAHLDALTLSPKPPSSGMIFDADALQSCLNTFGGRATVKIVVFDEVDFEFARQVFSHCTRVDKVVQVGNPEVREDATLARHALLDAYGALCARVLREGWHDVRVLPQLHTLTWGNKRAI